MNQETREMRVAVLIDAENVASKYISIILNEANSLGNIIIKRIYGDWTSQQMGAWRRVILDNSVQPIQQYSNVSGKNSSDSALIIDAMDLLYQGRLDCFCIVSSDSDFTRLAARLRESEMYVLGMGERKTPQSFISACNKFSYIDLLYAASLPEVKPAAKNADKAQEKNGSAGKSTSDKASQKKNGADKGAADKNGTDKSAADKNGTDKAAADKNGTDKAAAEKSSSGKAAGKGRGKTAKSAKANGRTAADTLKTDSAAEFPPASAEQAPALQDLSPVLSEQSADAGQADELPGSDGQDEAAGSVEAKGGTQLAVIRRALAAIADENSDDDGWISSSLLGNLLGKQYPDFDVRNFRFKKFVPFVASLGIFERRREALNVFFRLKS